MSLLEDLTAQHGVSIDDILGDGKDSVLKLTNLVEKIKKPIRVKMKIFSFVSIRKEAHFFS